MLPFVVTVTLPTSVAAQSAFSGVVTDAERGVITAVTVEASSSALIEKQRVATTDNRGRYTIVDLRPGVYRLAFSLAGFGTYVRDNIELPSNFTATVNAVLQIGALEETLTVSGQAPVADVQSTQPVVAVNRSFLDAVPNTRVWQAAATMMPAVKPSLQNIGAARRRLPALSWVPRQTQPTRQGARRKRISLCRSQSPTR
jgi:hypothetical protein